MLLACYFPATAADALASKLLDEVELSAVDGLVMGLADVVETDDVHVPSNPINELDPKPQVGAICLSSRTEVKARRGRWCIPRIESYRKPCANAKPSSHTPLAGIISEGEIASNQTISSRDRELPIAFNGSLLT
jgi:hypothetical protein